MFVHEIVAVRKGGQAPKGGESLKVIELNVVGADARDPTDGPRINNTIHIEDTRAGLEAMFGEDFDVGKKYRLSRLEFEPAEE